MAIHPIEFRYGSYEMKGVWDEQSRLKKVLSVEVALANAEVEIGMIPKNAAIAIEDAASKVELERVKEIEDEINHDMMAIVLALSEQCGDYGKWVHFGATSNDMLDTATALQFKDAIDIFFVQARRLRSVLTALALEHKNTVCVARTHGQIGIPTTYGLRFAIWASEVDRHITRLKELIPRVVVGKMSGASGTQAAFGKHGLKVQELAMKHLGINSVDVSNQIIQRDRHSEFVFWMANLATTLDKISTEIRSLQRSEIGEVQESFGKKQVGSSTMPHKRNPIKSEQICGLARVIRGMVEPELLNNTLWDERDLTNSASERVIFPEVCILTDHILRTATKVIKNLRFYPDNIKQNLELLNGLNMGEAVMIELAKRGVGRQEAHKLVRECAMLAREEKLHMQDALLANSTIRQSLSREEIAQIMNPYDYIGTAVVQVEMLAEVMQAMGKEDETLKHCKACALQK
ncbi:MAG: adenylosuccinate lyase [Candidatus Argoarchaeum ethanivorans]|uniref:Adenylosuccinate lyase n=1 Tax=Candidatus Argoarchaeum ethanivorans TaxID=2608793 RepID=A0A8B3RZ04_9EURY|nr:MAG: adenylosuccinate lyase [Candidatus Argoarchaeum ethanivorans]